MESRNEIRQTDYRERLVEIMGRNWENIVKREDADDDEKDAIHDVFVKLYMEKDEKVIEIILGDEKAAKTYIYKLINTYKCDVKRKRMKLRSNAEDIRRELQQDEKFEETKEEVIDTLEKLEDFVRRNVTMSCREKKLWDLLLDGESREGIMEKMGYANCHILQVHLSRLKKRIRRYFSLITVSCLFIFDGIYI